MTDTTVTPHFLTQHICQSGRVTLAPRALQAARDATPALLQLQVSTYSSSHVGHHFIRV